MNYISFINENEKMENSIITKHVLILYLITRDIEKLFFFHILYW